MFEGATAAEICYCEAIRAKDDGLRTFLSTCKSSPDPAELLSYLTNLKDILGNLNNDVSFVASLLVKPFLRKRFGIEFDAALKPQGAAGPDVDCAVSGGTRVVGEIKTTKPYQPGFGAAQKREIWKDLRRLSSSNAQHRFMFVTDAASYRTLCGKNYASGAPGVEIVNLVTGESFVCPRERVSDPAPSDAVVPS